MASRRVFVFVFVFCLIGALPAGDAFAQKKRPPVEFDEEETPLQEALKDAYKENARKKKDKMGPGENKDKCAEAIERNNINQIAQFCEDVGTAELTKLGSQDLKHPDNKAAGKRVVTKTVLRYTNPKAKGRADDAVTEKWPATKRAAAILPDTAMAETSMVTSAP